MKFKFNNTICYILSIIFILFILFILFNLFYIFYIFSSRFYLNNLGKLLKEGFYKDADEVNYPIESTHSPYDFTINYN